MFLILTFNLLLIIFISTCAAEMRE